MKSRLGIFICLILVMAMAIGCRRNSSDDSQMHGTAFGAGLGAIAGLALGAIAGDAALGAKVGAVSGAAQGTAYEFDSKRQDRRNRELTTAIAANQQAPAQQAAVPQGETVAQTGTRHLDDFLGEWNISAWAMKGDGTKISGTGKAKVIMDTKKSARFSINDVMAEGVTQDVDGAAILGYSESNGFTLECTSTAYSGTRKYVGEYLPVTNVYNFYPTDTASKTGSTGVTRSNIKVEVRASGNMISINTYSMISGQEVQIQSYRFTK